MHFCPIINHANISEKVRQDQLQNNVELTLQTQNGRRTQQKTKKYEFMFTSFADTKKTRSSASALSTHFNSFARKLTVLSKC